MIYFEALDDLFFTLYDFLAMEAHPVPQNVTSFEFRLVGDMTLKQFGYLATGLVIAYLTFVIGFSAVPYIAGPIIALSAGIGAAFAFLPINDRPLDHWIVAFFHAIYSPTKRVWKSPFNQALTPIFKEQLVKNRLQFFLQSNTPLPTPPSPVTTAAIMPNLKRLPTQPEAVTPSPILQPQPHAMHPITNPTPTGTPPTPIKPEPTPSQSGSTHPTLPTGKLPSQEELNQLVEMARQAQSLQARTIALEKELSQLKFTLTSQSQNSANSLKNLNDTKLELQQTVNKLQTLSGSKLTQPIPQPFVPQISKGEVIVIEPLKSQKTEMVLTSAPNVINGIVTDAGNNYLDGVIVIIHDKNNLPVRALKTNKLGQFTGATPLPSDVYTLTMEKDSFEFDTLQITLSDTVLAPIKVTAKTKA